jgi:hypothetical protein
MACFGRWGKSRAICLRELQESTYYRIIWHIRPPYVARASFSTFSWGGSYVKGKLICQPWVSTLSNHIPQLNMSFLTSLCTTNSLILPLANKMSNIEVGTGLFWSIYYTLIGGAYIPSDCRVCKPLFGGVLYARGTYIKGGSYMPNNTVSYYL